MSVQILESEAIIRYIIPSILFPLIIYYIIFKQLTKPHNPPLPPGPTPWPIIGNIHEFKSISIVSLAKLSQTYGPLMTLKQGTQYLIVGSSHVAAQEILKTNDRMLCARSVPQPVPLTRSEIERLSFWGDPWSENWKNIRTVCQTELFSNRALESKARLREEKAMEMVKFLKGKEGMVVNLQDLVFVTVVNMFSNAFFSRDFLSLGEESGLNMMNVLIRGIIQAILAPNMADFYPVLGRLDVQGWRKKHRELSNRMHELWETDVKERRERGKKGSFGNQDFLETLLENGFSDEQINQLFEELFEAGIDTTTSTINRTMVELLNSPECMKKLQQELEIEIDPNTLKTSQVLKLPYVEACIKETLRLHPPAPLLLSHRAHKKCQVMNYTIPENARILVNVWAIARDPSVWDEPFEYRPERFLKSDVNFKGNDFQFLPFGSGRRICPGLNMAAKILPLAIAALLYSFDWSYANGSDPFLHQEFRATSRIMQPLLLIPYSRK